MFTFWAFVIENLLSCRRLFNFSLLTFGDAFNIYSGPNFSILVYYINKVLKLVKLIT